MLVGMHNEKKKWNHHIKNQRGQLQLSYEFCWGTIQVGVPQRSGKLLWSSKSRQIHIGKVVSDAKNTKILNFL